MSKPLQTALILAFAVGLPQSASAAGFGPSELALPWLGLAGLAGLTLRAERRRDALAALETALQARSRVTR